MSESIASEIIAGLEAFAADLEAGRFDRYQEMTHTYQILDFPCPSCGSRLARGRGLTSCTSRGCKYSWEPRAGDEGEIGKSP